MVRRNRLYTVNRFNRGMFNPIQEKLFPNGGALLAADRLASAQFGANYGNAGNTLSDYMNSTNAFGISKAANPFSKMNLKGGLGAMASTPIGGSLVSGLAGTVGSVAGNAISGGLESGVGNAIGNIGGTVGSAVGAVNPLLGAAVGVGSQLVGGLVNRAFGTKVDQAALNAANKGTDMLNNFTSNVTDFDAIKGPEAVENVGNVYEGGWFSSGDARRKNEELKRKRREAQQFAYRSVDNNIENIISDQMNDALANYAAYGGLLNSFANGGLMYDLFQNFGNDPIGAVMKYNQGLEDEAAREELLRRNEAQSQQLDAIRNTPNYTINITRNYGPEVPNNIQPEDIEIPDIPGMPDIPGTIRKPDPELGLSSYTSKAATEDRIYETLPQMLKKAGLDVKVTSGYRKAGKAGKAGNMSWHPKHGAVDIVPHGNTTFEDIEKAVLTNPEIKSYMLTNGYGYLDETNRSKEGKTLMAKTGATGNHFHFGKDTSARNNYQRRINLHAFGGELGTNGTDFTNGLLYIDEGGSHENNPLEGVPMGVDAEGIPNLVEEGETVYNDYVFSDRMTVPDFMLKDLGLPKSKKGISFADASKKLAQESEKRPNDPISKDGLQVSLSRLAEIQETERMKKQAEEYTRLEKYACGGKMGRKYAGTGSQTNRLKSLGYDPFRFWDYNYLLANNPRAGRVVTSWTGSTNQENPNDFGKDKGEGYPSGIDIQIPNQIGIKPAPINAPFVEPNIPDSIDMKPINVPKAKNYSPEVDSDDYTGLGEPKKYATWMRYAPVIGSGIMSLTDMLGLTNKPDYTYADKIAAAAGSAGYAPNVSYNPIGNYLRYNPMDIWFEQNRMDANARATDRAIQNNAAPIGTKIAGLLASGYNSQIADGQLYRNALEYNDAKRERVSDFNRKTNMFNSQMGLEAAMANARYRQAAQQMSLSGLAQAAALRDQIDARVNAARSANLSNFLTSLGNIGRENFAMNQINTDRSRRYYGDLSGNTDGYKRKCGGKLKK